MTFEEELEAWIITYLVAHPNFSINPRVVIDNVPRSFVMKISDPEEIFHFMLNMEATNGVIQRTYYENFKLTDRGKLYFRQFIEPLFDISKDKKLYSAIIDKTEGKQETKEKFKELLNSIKNELPDAAEALVVEFLKKASVEMIFYMIKLVMSAHSAS